MGEIVRVFVCPFCGETHKIEKEPDMIQNYHKAVDVLACFEPHVPISNVAWFQMVIKSLHDLVDEK